MRRSRHIFFLMWDRTCPTPAAQSSSAVCFEKTSSTLQMRAKSTQTHGDYLNLDCSSCLSLLSQLVSFLSNLQLSAVKDVNNECDLCYYVCCYSLFHETRMCHVVPGKESFSFFFLFFFLFSVLFFSCSCSNGVMGLDSTGVTVPQ